MGDERSVGDGVKAKETMMLSETGDIRCHVTIYRYNQDFPSGAVLRQSGMHSNDASLCVSRDFYWCYPITTLSCIQRLGGNR